MYARILASFCLLCVSSSSGEAQSPAPVQRKVEVHLKGDDNSSPDVLWAMRRELESVMQNAGFHLVWHGSGDPPANGGAYQLIMVELRGTCSPTLAARNTPLPTPRVLASSAVVDGRILPFTWVDCAALNRFIAPVIAEGSEAQQTFLFGRSMARLLAHEFYHVLARTEDHTLTGVAKARVSISDMLAEHFDFEPVALDRVRPPTETGVEDAVDSGR